MVQLYLELYVKEPRIQAHKALMAAMSAYKEMNKVNRILDIMNRSIDC